MKKIIYILLVGIWATSPELMAQSKKSKNETGLYGHLIETERAAAKLTHETLEKSEKRLSSPYEKTDYDTVYSDNRQKPVVVLTREVLYTPEKFIYNLTENVVSVYSHQRFKIMDKLGADNFRVVYAPTHSTYEVLVGKSADKMQIVTKSTAVNELSSNEVPNFYQQFHFPYAEYQKLAMPGLEPGDIIEIKVLYKLSYPVKNLGPQLIWLKDIYPVQKQRFVFEGIGEFNFHFKSFNNCPKPFKTKLEGKFNAYELEMDSAQSRHSEYYSDWFDNLPGFKFYYSTELATKERINKDISIKDITTLYEKAPDQFSVSYSLYIKEIIAYLEKYYAKASKEAKAREAYYYLRTVTVVRLNTTGMKFLGGNGVRDNSLVEPGCRFYNEILKGVFEYFKIPYAYAFGMPRHSGLVKYALNGEEMITGLQVNTDKPFYIFPIEANTMPYEVPPSLEGTKVVIHNPKSSTKDHLDSIPVSRPDSNCAKILYQVKMEPGFEKLRVKESVDVNGYMRFRYLNFMQINKEYVESDYERAHVTLTKSAMVHKNNSRLISEEFEANLSEEDQEKQRIVQVESELDDNNLMYEKVHKVKLYSQGRYHTDPHVRGEMEYSLMQLVSKAGSHYVVSLGKLIGSQLEITGEDTVRDYLVTQKFLREFRYTVQFEIPAGYAVEDLTAFQSDKTNASCLVTSKASVNNNILTIEIVRSFQKKEDPANAWKNYLEVLDETYRLSEGKILLKKL